MPKLPLTRNTLPHEIRMPCLMYAAILHFYGRFHNLYMAVIFFCICLRLLNMTLSDSINISQPQDIAVRSDLNLDNLDKETRSPVDLQQVCLFIKEGFFKEGFFKEGFLGRAGFSSIYCSGLIKGAFFSKRFKRFRFYFHFLLTFYFISFIQDLNPGATYYYQVHSGNLSSPQYEFVAMKVKEVNGNVQPTRVDDFRS